MACNRSRLGAIGPEAKQQRVAISPKDVVSNEEHLKRRRSLFAWAFGEGECHGSRFTSLADRHPDSDHPLDLAVWWPARIVGANRRITRAAIRANTSLTVQWAGLDVPRRTKLSDDSWQDRDWETRTHRHYGAPLRNARVRRFAPIDPIRRRNDWLCRCADGQDTAVPDWEPLCRFRLSDGQTAIISVGGNVGGCATERTVIRSSRGQNPSIRARRRLRAAPGRARLGQRIGGLSARGSASCLRCRSSRSSDARRIGKPCRRQRS
jgi:hypothetical protein